MSTNATRVVLADDEVLMREGLAGLLERSGFEVVGQCGNASELIDLVRELRPDLVIVDIRMPPTHTTEGLEAAETIREEFPDTAIVALSAHVQVERATALLASGERSGYLLKSRVTDVEDFVDTLERIVKGASVIDPALVLELVAARGVRDPLDVLSPREREVLALMAEGRSNAGIATRAVDHRVDRREARPRDPQEAAPACGRGRSTPRARRGHVPQRPLASSIGWGADKAQDRGPRQLSLGDESRRRARSDLLGVLALRVGGDQDHRAAQPPCEVESTLVTEADVDQQDVRPKLLR